MNSHYFYNHSVMSLAYLYNERTIPGGAGRVHQIVRSPHGIPQVAGILAVMHAANGNTDRAKELLGQMLDAQTHGYVWAKNFASV